MPQWPLVTSRSLALGFAVSSPPLVLTARCRQEQADEKPSPQVENAKHQFFGEINDNAVYVRSGPEQQLLPDDEAQEGRQVTVVGIKYDWLKILPPEGSFSYVPQAYVTRRGDGKVGRVNQTAERAGGLVAQRDEDDRAVKLNEGEDVRSSARKTSTSRSSRRRGVPVRPPAIRRAHRPGKCPGADRRQSKKPGELTEEPTEKRSRGQPSEPSRSVERREPRSPTAARRTDGAHEPSAVASAVEDFQALEAEFEAASKLPMIDQPVEQLTERYAALAESRR